MVLLPAPVAAGESAANMILNTGDVRVLTRWVARRTGTLDALHLRIDVSGARCKLGERSGYGLGNGGSWHVTTHPVLDDGRPDVSHTLAVQDFRPCEARPPVVDIRRGLTRLAMGIDVERGREYATIVSNRDPKPGENWSSTNHLYTSTGILGANGRNERSSAAVDAFYGLDPRELVGYSRDGGRTWALPGGEYGRPAGRSFLPTYVQEFADGVRTGQPYSYATAPSEAERTMVFRNVDRPWRIRALGAYTLEGGTGTLTLTVAGRQRARAAVTGRGMLRANIEPVTVAPGQMVKMTARGLTIRNVVADTAWGRLVGMHLPTRPWYIEGEPNYSHAAPVYPLPCAGC